ncbi:YncE family protein [Streptomyces sp. NPDC050625]|uniref:YncE family protein n=1 Tax=Streptomyces sp. NPDC050625 TaxID=3154629 RepID=UPI0034366813
MTAQPHEIAIDYAAGLLYVSHTYRSGVYTAPGEKAHEISVVDPYGREVVEVLSLDPEEAHHGLALDQDRGLLYATVEAGPAGGGAIVVIDTATRRQIDRIEVGARGPHWFAITPDGRKGYATNKADPFISVLDLVERTPAGCIPAPYGTEEIAVSPDGRLAYAAGRALHYDNERAGEAPATLMVIDTASDATDRQEPLDAPACPVHVATDGRVLVGLVRRDGRGAPADGQLTVLSPGGLAPFVTAPVGEVPITIRTTPAGERAFVANLRSGTLHVVDLATVTVTAVLDIDPGDPDSTPGAHGIV